MEMVQTVFDQEELVVAGNEGSRHVACRFEMSMTILWNTLL